MADFSLDEAEERRQAHQAAIEAAADEATAAEREGRVVDKEVQESEKAHLREVTRADRRAHKLASAKGIR